MKDRLEGALRTCCEEKPIKMSPWMVETDPRIIRRTNKTGEECNELGKVLHRINMQGIDGVDPATGKSNRQSMQEEIADVIAQCQINVNFFDLDRDAIAKRVIKKMAQMEEWEDLVGGKP